MNEALEAVQLFPYEAYGFMDGWMEGMEGVEGWMSCGDSRAGALVVGGAFLDLCLTSLQRQSHIYP